MPNATHEITVTYYVSRIADRQEIRDTELRMWKPLLGDALENVHVKVISHE
jgi:hypothetical protein